MSEAEDIGRPDASGKGSFRVGFIVTAPFHLFHYGAIRRHLDCDVVVYVDVRDDDFGVTRALVEKHVGNCETRWVLNSQLGKIDGECDVLVCQTPLTLMKFFEKSLVVAEQYSLAKEQYQYGLWRAQASLNLMYGHYSAGVVSPFSTAVATGNPLFDAHVPKDGLPQLESQVGGKLRVLYMPTYGDLSDRASVLKALLAQGVELTIKAHHADFEIKALADEHGVPVYFSDSDPIELICASSLVVSDYSGAIYDALAMRKPVALVDSLNLQSADAARLSSDDVSHASVSRLAATWPLEGALQDAYDESYRKLSDESAYKEFIGHFYVNFGCASAACANEIMRLHEAGEVQSFAVQQIRETVRRYVAENRSLRRKLKSSKSRRRGGRQPGLLAMLLPDAMQGLWDEPMRVLFLKSVRFGLLSLPGGERVLQRLRGLRGRPAEHSDLVAGQDASSGENGTGASPGDECSELSEVPRIRRRQVAELLRQSLDERGVEYRAEVDDYRAYVAVREQDLDVLHDALGIMQRNVGVEITFWLGSGTRYDTVRRSGDLRLADLAACESFVLGVPLKVGSYAIGRAGGVEVLLLTGQGARLTARRRRAEKADWTLEFSGRERTAMARGEPADVKPGKDGQHVDVVYTWVDSSDEEWAAQRRKWAGLSNIVMASAGNEERYMDREELRYSLRSLWLYAPFIRNIYIVTSGHRPAWLADDNDRLRVVSHDVIFPDEAALPTFNSHSIEACLHRIPGLAENFLYFNDDFFLGREVRFEDFYTKAGLMKSRFSPSSFVAEDEPAPDAIPTDWASYNAVKLMRDEFGLKFDRKLKHIPYSMKKSMLEEMEERYPDAFRSTRASRFRDHRDYAIPSMLSHYYGVATGRGVEWDGLPKEYAYADTGRRDFRSRLAGISKSSPMFFCLNATMHEDIDFKAQAEFLKEFLDARFPVPSPYER
ncbi:stealth conserved region 3 domain-containing protein [Stenotrophomonas mori]|uniref:Capsular polysaccharide phosphotransferase SacB n=1 Tax=Stenotrophomonas mori TaxID=2871096 RepID=A0ABT0SHZ7_9GAMM|nr:stealth conserved region 3 domain-containing protein [Stenotrophomonas mori]MCL7714939.1 stealth conserved region 3 domain-containing protein [Stenotrophomonas mori]